MSDFYKQTALEIYLNNIKTGLPSITEHELELIKYAFETGFNIGNCNNAPQIVQELSLQMLARSK